MAEPAAVAGGELAVGFAAAGRSGESRQSRALGGKGRSQIA